MRRIEAQGGFERSLETMEDCCTINPLYGDCFPSVGALVPRGAST